MSYGQVIDHQNIQSDIFEAISLSSHEQVTFCNDRSTGLKAIIAVHNTVLGPSLGGTRFWNYSSEREALIDVLRLSRGMTYKSAISGINLGGGKAVIIGNPKEIASEALWRRFGKFVNSLSGKYITAEDVGTSTADMEIVASETKHVTGKPLYMGGGGDPSPVTAYGVYLGMKASAKKMYGSDSLQGKKIVVQGVGHVGAYLVDLLIKENANIYISDINNERILSITDKYKVNVIDNNNLYKTDMDIYAPCALGATLNDETIPSLKCKIVAGAANNQLKDEKKHGTELKEKGILYAPDFLINAGGVINCYAELGGYNKDRAYGTAEKIYTRTLEIFNVAELENITTQEAAIQLAEKRIAEIAKVKSML
jgi:leucine dehydrogenase